MRTVGPTAQLDLFAARQERDNGMAKALAHADAIEPAWSDLAYTFLLGFIGASQGEFLTEDVRAAAHGAVPDPPDQRAWGGIVIRAVKAGLIRRAGYRPMRSKNCHANPKSSWIKTSK